MIDRPIYIDRGDGNFERFKGTLTDLQMPGWPDFFPGGLPPNFSGAVSAAADHVYYNEDVEADLLTMKQPTSAVWESLKRFIAKERR